MTFPSLPQPERPLVVIVPRRRLWLRLLLLALAAAVLVGAAATAGLARYGGSYAARPFAATSSLAADPEAKVISPAAAERIEARLAAQRPRGVYVTVDTYRNQLRVFRGEELLREAICSTGTGRVLHDPRTGRTWVFDTPLGEHPIIDKRRNPVWAKPDWAFIEDGYEPPPRGSPDRFDDISLGGYGLYMPDGYIIHGTLFKTLLGKRVTHGCVRLGDDDLEFVYKTVPLGARVFLY
ncbi:MAG: L,D-transpeptidase [Acidobacteria bacterium]|jgi:L,D-transpeptidase YbiS|nr:L,D-transpeptidase [Thermoanaerobaculia bacterium]MDI9631223.1 L,D-transpeptidase [Acidobacteriota bacterium]OQC38598.1 MAG: putative L,D-transpeptidase YbiS precursor [Acidobacteria bacterium ADurb.Bin051]MBP7812504.1 L,D-transpeptidase [Thermoanaerobaculia bacterium]MBP8844512.1 L,D-transpeptidase [Thermoanaerobaculia bacterium]